MLIFCRLFHSFFLNEDIWYNLKHSTSQHVLSAPLKIKTDWRSSMREHIATTCNQLIVYSFSNTIYYVAEFASGQDEANLVF